MTASESSYLGSALVAHLDVLGFKQKYILLTTTQNLFELGYKIESAFNRIQANEDILVRTFSDNIMLVKPIPNSVLTDKILFSFIYHIANIQIDLFTKYGWVIRGGISFGDHYHSEITIVSKPLVEAYLLESHKIVYPFVGIGQLPNFPSRKSKSDYYNSTIEYQLIDLLTIPHPDLDLRCIDYLVIPILNAYLYDSTTSGVYEKLKILLLNHKYMIIDGYESSSDPNIIEKYDALAHYHNNFWNTLLDKFQLLSSIQRGLKIDVISFIEKWKADWDELSL